jgi:hypothetical protein
MGTPFCCSICDEPLDNLALKRARRRRVVNITEGQIVKMMVAVVIAAAFCFGMIAGLGLAEIFP